jgi:ATP-binding cassette subfamily B protein/subfamily B ATP-binding cassette protein MsbA
MRISLYSALTKPITEVMGITMIALALLAGAYLVLNQETHLFGIRMSDRPLDVPSLLIFYGLLIGTTEPARKLSEIFNSIQAAVAAADRLYPMLDREPSIKNCAAPVDLPPRHGQLVFRHVSFHYVPGTPVLHDVDLTVKYGETIAIVGPNGCGKTTLIQLLPRFFDPVEGTVLWNDVDLRDVRLRDLRKRISIVTQQSLLFDASVFHNIQCGRLSATEEEVREAAEKARAHRFITERLSEGYETIVGSGGSRLSGGQRQRIALARAILRDPEILILDEATSQVDLESEQLIHQALEEFCRGRTTFIITHRPATLALADRILVLNAGHVEDFGTHQELAHRCGFYQRLFATQYQQTA